MDPKTSFLLGSLALVAVLPILGGALLWVDRTCRHLRGKSTVRPI